jgi:hypothetical protein
MFADGFQNFFAVPLLEKSSTNILFVPIKLFTKLSCKATNSGDFDPNRKPPLTLKLTLESRLRHVYFSGQVQNTFPLYFFQFHPVKMSLSHVSL